MTNEHAGWLRPRDVLARLDDDAEEQNKQAILGRLKDGLIGAVGIQTVHVEGREPSVPTEEGFPQHLWAKPWEPDLSGFWTFGDASFETGPTMGDHGAFVNRGVPLPPVRRVSIRSVLLNPSDVVRQFGAPFQMAAQPVTQRNQNERSSGTSALKPVTEPEMKRFARLYLGIWENQATEAKALAAAKATYPENAVPRDPFYDVFRAIRGHKKRGKQPLRG